MEGVDTALVMARADKLFFYSPYNFLRSVPEGGQQQLFGTGLASGYGEGPQQSVYDLEGIQFLYTFLSWDTEFFGAPVYKLFTVLFPAKVSLALLIASMHRFQQYLRKLGGAYLFVELPVEDSTLTQALGQAGWRLVETRLNFYHDAVAAFTHRRYPVRLARTEEAAHIGSIAAAVRNAYDRFHADSWFGNEKADAFLHRYAAAAVQGYCSAVLVPHEPGLPIDAFLAISDSQAHADSLGFCSSRIALTAVGPANRGWHLKLVAETLQRARTMQFDYVFMTTQATNRAVFRTCEKSGFKLGGTTCILAYSF